MPDGILNLYKPHGLTSHDVVARVRALTGVRRVGHTGTLDPQATGVLVVCVGRAATRVAEYLMAGQKTYRAQVRLGIVTRTYDAEGPIVAEAPVDVSRAQVDDALTSFRGTIEQVPPMYSAVKHRGEPLYRLARRGRYVTRKARQVEIYRLELIAWDPPECILEVVCSPGTYVRTLAHDLGQHLSCGAHLAGLIRLASGSFHLNDAITLEQLTRAADKGRWPDLLLPIDEALADYFPALYLDADAAWRLCSGQMISCADVVKIERSTSEDPVSLHRVYDPEGVFLALAYCDPSKGAWRPHKVLFSPYPKPQPESANKKG